MAKCRWCEKTLPGNAIPACGNCILKTRYEADPSKNEEEASIEDLALANYSLSGLGNAKKEVQYSKGTSKGSIIHTLYTQTAFTERPREKQEIPMKKVKIKSNNIRGRLSIVGGVVLSFDDDGIAEINEYDLHVITEYSRVRPGRLSVVVEPKKAPAPAPVPAPKKAEPEAESKKEEPKVTKSESSKKSSEKKAPKKDSE